MEPKKEQKPQVNVDTEAIGEGSTSPALQPGTPSDCTPLLREKAERLLTDMRRCSERIANNWDQQTSVESVNLFQSLLDLFIIGQSDANDVQTGCKTFGAIVICSRLGNFIEIYKLVIEKTLEVFPLSNCVQATQIELLKLWEIMALKCPIISQPTFTGKLASFVEGLHRYAAADFETIKAALKFLEVVGEFQVVPKETETDNFLAALSHWYVAYLNECRDGDQHNTRFFSNKLVNIVLAVGRSPMVADQVLRLTKFMDLVSIKSDMNGWEIFLEHLCSLIRKLIVKNGERRTEILRECRQLIDRDNEASGNDGVLSLINDLRELLSILEKV